MTWLSFNLTHFLIETDKENGGSNGRDNGGSNGGGNGGSTDYYGGSSGSYSDYGGGNGDSTEIDPLSIRKQDRLNKKDQLLQLLI